ncbi:MAG: galactose mutarotase [Phycisphaerae bacterium]|nr:galactose mutarotase [Phycisphaerae bacterium]
MPDIQHETYGRLPDGRDVSLLTLTNDHGVRVRLLDFGAIVASVEVPDRNGELADITLGYDDVAGWLDNAPYFGATIGRCANRIGKAAFKLDGKTYKLAANNGENHLHGGNVGFNKVLWKAEPSSVPDAAGVHFMHLSRDGEEAYPGNLNVVVTYTLTNDNALRIEFAATTDAPTICNLAHHTYWNLSGAAAGDILDHELMIDADAYTASDSDLITTGEIKPVAGTPLDFTKPTPMGARINDVPGGYDLNYVLRNKTDLIVLAARVRDPKSGRVLEVHTDQPGIQFYTGNFLDGSITGKAGINYRRHHGFCLETQRFPNAPNIPGFPSVVLRPGEKYEHVMVHKFLTE